MKRRTFNRTTIIEHPEGYCDVILPDNTAFTAVPQTDEAYRQRAEFLGYKSPREMCLEHDATHALLAAVFGLEVSPALYAAGHGLPISDVTGAEEDAVLAVQRWLNMLRKHGYL